MDKKAYLQNVINNVKDYNCSIYDLRMMIFKLQGLLELDSSENFTKEFKLMLKSLIQKMSAIERKLSEVIKITDSIESVLDCKCS